MSIRIAGDLVKLAHDEMRERCAEIAIETALAINKGTIANPKSVTGIAEIIAAEKRHGIYIASKTKHARRWRYLRDKVGEPIISTWIDEAGEGESACLHDLWRRCLQEAASARVLIVYREKDEVMKGAWVEVGAALANGVPVFAIGLDGFTISQYRGIAHFPDMKSAIAAARALTAPSQPASAGEPMLARFGHHPDPAIDFCIEVEVIEGEWLNLKAGFLNGTPTREQLEDRVFKAMQFRAGGDEGAVNAKHALRKIEAEIGNPSPNEGKAEPVAWQHRIRHLEHGHPAGDRWSDWKSGRLSYYPAEKIEYEERPLYAHPPAQPAPAVDALVMPKKLSPEVIAACVGGGITSAQIEHIYSLVHAAVSLYQAAPMPAPAVDRED